MIMSSYHFLSYFVKTNVRNAKNRFLVCLFVFFSSRFFSFLSSFKYEKMLTYFPFKIEISKCPTGLAKAKCA